LLNTFLTSFSCVDLTHTLDSKVPTWGGNSDFKMEITTDYDQGWRVHTCQMNKAGVGTHMDAPAHRIKNGITIDQIEVKNFIAEAYVIDVSSKALNNPDYLVT